MGVIIVCCREIWPCNSWLLCGSLGVILVFCREVWVSFLFTVGKSGCHS